MKRGRRPVPSYKKRVGVNMTLDPNIASGLRAYADAEGISIASAGELFLRTGMELLDVKIPKRMGEK